MIAGEAILLPRNDPHLMGSDLSLPPVPGRDIIHPPKDGGLFSIHHGGNGERTQVVCGYLGCASAKDNPVISTLPAMLKLDAGDDEENRSARHSDTPRRRFPPGVRDRRRFWPSFRSCCSLKRCGVTRSSCQTTRRDGLPDCASLMLGGHWRSFTATSPGVGQLMTLAVRSACRVRRWLTASFV